MLYHSPLTLTMNISNLNHTNLACKDYYKKYYLFHGRVMEKLRIYRHRLISSFLFLYSVMVALQKIAFIKILTHFR